MEVQDPINGNHIKICRERKKVLLRLEKCRCECMVHIRIYVVLRWKKKSDFFNLCCDFIVNLVETY